MLDEVALEKSQPYLPEIEKPQSPTPSEHLKEEESPTNERVESLEIKQEKSGEKKEESLQ